MERKGGEKGQERNGRQPGSQASRHQVPSTINEDKPTPRHTIMKFLRRKNTGDKEKVFKNKPRKKTRNLRNRVSSQEKSKRNHQDNKGRSQDGSWMK